LETFLNAGLFSAFRDGEVAGSIEKTSFLESGMLYLAETLGEAQAVARLA